MKTRHNAWLLWIMMLVSCGNSNHVRLSMPGIVSAKLTVTSLKNPEVLFEKNIQDEEVQFGVLESGIGMEAVEIKVSGARYEGIGSNEIEFESGEFFSAIVTKDVIGSDLNVNALTTLSSCRFKHTFNAENQNVDERVDVENTLISQQVILDSLHGFWPNTDVDMKAFNPEEVYGILIGGFDQLAKDHLMTTSELVKWLCSDVSFDGIFNGIDAQGAISDRTPNYDEHILRVNYGEAINRFAQENLKFFNSLPVDVLADQVALSSVPGLF